MASKSCSFFWMGVKFFCEYSFFSFLGSGNSTLLLLLGIILLIGMSSSLDFA